MEAVYHGRQTHSEWVLRTYALEWVSWHIIIAIFCIVSNKMKSCRMNEIIVKPVYNSTRLSSNCRYFFVYLQYGEQFRYENTN